MSFILVAPSIVFVVAQRPKEPKLSSEHPVPSEHLVPPAWSCTTSTVYSAHLPASLLHLASDRGVRHVSASHPPSCRSDEDRHPRAAVHTLRRLPFPDSRTASLRPLPSWGSNEALANPP